MTKAHRNSLAYIFSVFSLWTYAHLQQQDIEVILKKMSFHNVKCHKSFFPESSHEIRHAYVNKERPQELIL